MYIYIYIHIYIYIEREREREREKERERDRGRGREIGRDEAKVKGSWFEVWGGGGTTGHEPLGREIQQVTSPWSPRPSALGGWSTRVTRS